MARTNTPHFDASQPAAEFARHTGIARSTHDDDAIDGIRITLNMAAHQHGAHAVAHQEPLHTRLALVNPFLDGPQVVGHPIEAALVGEIPITRPRFQSASQGFRLQWHLY